MKFRIVTLGCRVNQIESEAIAESFVRAGFECADGLDADIYVVNSCGVTGKADQKTRRLCRLFLKKGVVLLTGCSVSPDGMDGTLAGADGLVVVENRGKGDMLALPGFIASVGIADCGAIRGFLKFRRETGGDVRFSFNPTFFSEHSRGFLKVQDGCDRKCSFCRVWIARGAPASLDCAEVVERFLKLQDSGILEVTLTGVNLALYRSGGVTLGRLIGILCAKASPDMRIRLSSVEPDLVDDCLLDAICDPHVAPYFHLPVQSASDAVLKLTGRSYGRERLRDIIAGLRAAKGNPFVSADVMTGLPGEGDAEFEETRSFLAEERFSYLHVFPFSPRRGTAAYSAPRPCERVRDERASALRELSASLYADYASGFAGRELMCIAERSEGGFRFWTADNYLKVRTDDSPSVSSGKRHRVRIDGIGEGMVFGTVLDI